MMSFTDNKSWLLILFCLGITACVSTGPVKYSKIAISEQERLIISSKPDYLRDSYQRLFEEGARNQVLNLMVIGKRAFDSGDLDLAAEAFDRAILQVESIYGNSESAAKARSLWYEEGSKEFKGEPYERSMLYYYRGLIYLAKEDFDNARASFLNSIMQDAFAEEQQNRSDFGSQLFLIGWSSMKSGSSTLAKQAFAELKTIDPSFVPPPSHHDVLIIAESGTSPRKLADGVGHHQLIYKRGKKIVDDRVDFVDANGKRLKLVTKEDIYWQASSRGGRQIDRIIDGKVNFKTTTEEVGGSLTDIGTIGIYLAAPLEGSGNIGGAVSLVGIAVMALSANSNVRADTRNWDNIPNLLHFVTTSKNSVNIQGGQFFYLNKKGERTHSKSANIVVTGKKQTLIWSNGESYE